ncbi:MAG: hypothetical protein OXH57_00400 [Ekhidna sp.]|nr:hypothetical protein [Ekhidna sp.]
MSKLLTIPGIFLLLICSKCNECDHCGEGGAAIYRYSLVNGLNDKLSVEVYSEEMITTFNLNVGDTSKSWDVSVLPVQLNSRFFTLDQNNFGNSFPYDSDSILVKIDDKVVRSFLESDSDDYTSQNWATCIYNEESYIIIPPRELPPNESVSGINPDIFLFYYILDSSNLILD